MQTHSDTPSSTPSFASRSWLLRAVLSLIGLGVVVYFGIRFARQEQLNQLLADANPWWLAATVVCKLLTPLGTAAVYQRSLKVLGHKMKLLPLWLVAQVAIFMVVAFPAGPVAMSALLLRVFRRKGVPEGTTTLAVALDTLTYLVAFLGLLVVGLAYLLTHGGLQVRQITEVGLISFGLVLGGMYLWGLQRDWADLTRKLVRAQQWLARLLHQKWTPAPVERFLDELYRGKALIGERPQEFARLLAIQAGVLVLDVLTLYCAFRALGSAPHLSVVVMSYALASFFASVAPLPGGGGSFEADSYDARAQALKEKASPPGLAGRGRARRHGDLSRADLLATDAAHGGDLSSFVGFEC